MDLLGGVKKIVGTARLNVNTEGLSIDNLLAYLEKNYTLQNKLKKNELMVAVNGVESSVLNGGNTKLVSGDVVTILSVVHGG